MINDRSAVKIFKRNKPVGNMNNGLGKRNNKKKILFVLPIALLCMVIALVVIRSSSKLSINSVISYYCSDSSYQLEGANCIKVLTQNSSLLADINSDEKIDEEDLNLLNEYVKSGQTSNFSKLQFKIADINIDGIINELDVKILEEYFTNLAGTSSTYSEKIGIERLCEDEYILNGDVCEYKKIIDADKREIFTEDKTDNTKIQNSNLDSKNIESVGSNKYNNPVIITLKPENDKTEIKVNTKYKMYVNFDIKDTRKQYYYIWKNYLYGKNNYSTGCNKVVQGDHYGAFTVNGTRKVDVTVYSDSSCKNKVTSV